MVSFLSAARDIGRVREISTVLVRHGFGEVATRLGLRRKGEGSDQPTPSVAGAATAERIRRVLEDLGPTFVKLGQVISTRSDLLPPTVIQELRKLQDSVSPIPYASISAQIEKALGASVEELFTTFSEAPLAAGSIAQVHAATLLVDGVEHRVAVKVQRPDIAQTVASDLDLLHSIAGMLERSIPETRVYSPTALVQQFDRAITAELDFTLEAENARRFEENFENLRELVHFPAVYRQTSAKQVLTMEYLEGVKLHEALAAGYDGQRIARTAMQVVIQMVFQDGFFHADPHPGNVFISGPTDHPVIGLIDLGMVGRLSPKLRNQIIDLMVAAARRDYEGVADALYVIGTPTRKVHRDTFRADIGMMAERYLGRSLREIEVSQLIRDLVAAGSRFGMEIPADFTLVAKAMMTLESIAKELAPDLDVFEETRPHFLRLLKKRYAPEALGHEFLRRAERWSEAADRLPEHLEEILEDLRCGRLTFHSHDPGLQVAAERLGRRILAGLVAAPLILCGTWLLTTEKQWVGGAVLLFAFLWLGSHGLAEVLRGWHERRQRP